MWNITRTEFQQNALSTAARLAGTPAGPSTHAALEAKWLRINKNPDILLIGIGSFEGPLCSNIKFVKNFKLRELGSASLQN